MLQRRPRFSGLGSCRCLTRQPSGDGQCHLYSLDPGDTWVTNNLQGVEGRPYQPSDLYFLVELRGFEPLTPSMRIQCSTGQTGQVTTSAQVSALGTVTITASETT
jgi:hypothetical protein